MQPFFQLFPTPYFYDVVAVRRAGYLEGSLYSTLVCTRIEHLLLNMHIPDCDRRVQSVVHSHDNGRADADEDVVGRVRHRPQECLLQQPQTQHQEKHHRHGQGTLRLLCKVRTNTAKKILWI